MHGGVSSHDHPVITPTKSFSLIAKHLTTSTSKTWFEMVTGVETAGLVLGSLPLLIAALENYDDIVQPTKAFFSWRKHRRKLVQELYTLRASYDQAINILLNPVVDLEELKDMIENPLSDKWTAGDIADNLRDMLGTAYDPLILTISEISYILGDIATHLGIQGPLQGTPHLRNMVLAHPSVANNQSLRKFEFKNRMLFTMKKSTIKQNLERLEICTQRINSWIDRAGRFIDERPRQFSKLKFAESLSRIQENATKIHDALSQSRCKTKPRHPTLLLMEQRLKRPKMKKSSHGISLISTMSEPMCFKLSINRECHQSLVPFNTEFRVTDSPIELKSTKQKVKISAPQQRMNDTPYHDPMKLPLVTDFCRFIEGPTHSPIGFCLDTTGKFRAYPSQITAIKYIDHIVTLESILPSLKERPPLAALYGLVITLVASIFQLSHTPWLHQTWNKKDIIFLRAYNESTLPVDIRYPYLMRDFSSESCLSSTTGGDCSNFLALAILLLEITSGRSIEEEREPEDLGKHGVVDEKADLRTLDRWYRKEIYRMTAGFSKAVLTCLQQYLDPTANLENPDYCQVIKEKILQPLEDEMHHLIH
ncbi:hypothetical protein B0J11DRAFT_575995 [Dendryphion nanum]|uniref:DUF7580 domain-containing protein n=1 Tax=Dendryphion nanum TaxID=256645 RepID=A0A9P9IU13_9PLEO|nr:hypothetical protein B0J11DRAFT_575995 [Dendryphion nanum]